MNNEPKDPLEKVSNSLRRAVNVNKTRESDLRSKVSTIQRERRDSINTWSLKQEKFLKAKLKMMPAIKFVERREIKERGEPPPRKLTFGVKPSEIVHKEVQLRKSSNIPTDLRCKYPNRLPPLTTSTTTVADTQSHDFHLKPGGKLEGQLTAEILNNKFPKSRRISEYKSPVHEYLYGNREEEQRQALRHKLSVHELKNAATLARKVSCYGTKMDEITEENDNSSFNQRHKDVAQVTISDVLPKDEEQGNRKAREKWRKIRESLSLIVARHKKKDISKMTMLELTSLFEGIRECRYLRVGNHTTYRGDSVDSKHCRCIACTVVDKTKLRNNLGAPD